MVKPKNPKENAEEVISENNSDTNRKTVGGVHNDNQTTTAASVDSTPETVQIIPVVEEDFDLTKKTIVHETTIVKRMATRTEKIEIPIVYEEVYVNNKRLKVYNKEEEGLLSKIKDTITHSVSRHDDDNIEYHYPPSSSSSSTSPPPSKSSEGNPKDGKNSNINTRGEAVALIEGQENGETEKMVPIWGEAIVVNKRKVKLGEMAIRKRRIIETKKIDVDIKKEKVSVEYPVGFKGEQKPAQPQESDT
jgi:stress response protein YsnF